MARTSQAKSKLYGKYGREIYVVAKSGGIDPAGNLALRGLLDRAKREQVPAHVIEKALDKAKGGGGEDYSVARYEGFGPGGSMVIVECLTDNPNRTFDFVRQCFHKTGSKLGTQGSVSHLFDHSAILVFPGDEEAALEALVDAGVDVTDIESADGKVTVFAPHTDLFKAKQALADALGEIEYEVDEIQFVPQTTTALAEDDQATFGRLLELLDELDDVQNVYHNAA